MTLLTYAGKYVLQSTGTVQTTSTSYGDDNVSQTFTLYGTKTVLAIYAANSTHGTTNTIGGMKNCISIDAVDHSEMYQSAYGSTYALKNTCVWVGSLAAGAHTIKGRVACNVASNTCNLTNRTLIIYIFDGDEFDYVENTTAVTAASTTLANDTYGVATRTPSAACKALCFYGVTNAHAATERYAGKQIQLTIGGTAQTDSLMRQGGNSTGNYADSCTTAYAVSRTAVSTAFQGQFAGNAVQTVTISRRFLCVLLLADSTVIDLDAGHNNLSSTVTAFADDTDISITRSHEGELLTVFAAMKENSTTSAIYGTAYGIMVDAADVANSRSTSAFSADANQALTAYAATVAAGSHTLKGRFAANVAGTAAYITDRLMIAIWFPVKTALTYRDKYIVQSGSTVSSSSSTFADDTPATKTFSLTASQTVLVFYNANSNYGDTNNVAGFKNAINVDGTDYALMYATGYAANYPMRNACVWVGTLASGSHTIKGRMASNTNATNTSITNRTLMIYIFDGDNYTYIDSTTTQALAASETFVDDTAALISITPKANSKALILYGVTNAPGTTEHYVGKKVIVAANGTDYTNCEARQSSYATGGTNPCSVATAYAITLTGNVNYTFKGRVASVYTYATYVSRRFFAVLVLDDTTLIDNDFSSESQDTDIIPLVDDATISITRTTLGELIAFYAATKTSFTTSDIQGNRYGIMIDGYDAASSRTSQSFSASANSCLIGAGATVFNQSHTVKGRFSTNENAGTVFITNRNLTTVWLARAVVSQTFTNTDDIRLSKPFSATNDLRLSKAFSSENDIVFAQLVNKMFSATNDILLSKPFSGYNDLRLSKAFSATVDVKVSKAFSASGDVRLSKAMAALNDIRVSKAFSAANDLRLSKGFAGSSDLRLSKPFTNTGDVEVSKAWSSFNDERLSKPMVSINDIRISKAFSATNDVIALFTLVYASRNDINLFKAFSSSLDIKLIKAFQSSSDALCSKIHNASNDIRLSLAKASSNDISVKTSFASTNYLFLSKIFHSSNEILGIVWAEFASTNNIWLEKTHTSTSDIVVDSTYASINDILIPHIFYSSTNDITVFRIKSSRNDIRRTKTWTNRSDVRVNRIHSSSNMLWFSAVKSSSNDIQLLKNFLSSDTIELYKSMAASNDVFVSKDFNASNKLRVDRFVESSNNVMFSKEFESMNDVLEFLEKFFSSTNTVYFSKEFEVTSDIRLNKAFSSGNIIIRVIWDLKCPLTVVISQDERTVVITSLSRTVTIDSESTNQNTVSVDRNLRTVEVDQPDRSVTINRC